ncbi:D-alanyl-D-alanine carboxypeptidase family protein [Alteribacter natronophilus]|uniref:D-alanyl-D-alanine carboxypeptidase family protein n=1 Tax=Alteribacter natronophilus TaxID=2583810 RepID=UPI00110EE4E0|nr:D-alanyl-D-alanine carboxypeptidase family protein [Alteribacter natronophilus]TMW73498.1 D-alanyl-D-alanine carboxypeptidase [Alteribacter natronophilus]
MKVIIAVIFICVFVIPPVSVEAGDRPGQLHSEAVVMVDTSTGEVLFDKNMHREMYPASITKIVTTIIALEEAGQSEKVEVSSEAVSVIGSSVYLLEEEILPLGQLLRGIMVSSGNDASIAVAEHIDGSTEAFAGRMNEFASSLGAENTNFTNPHGLFHDDHVTTAYDMALLSSYAMANRDFRDIAGTERLDWSAEGWETTLFNHHDLMRQNEEVTGVKNGFVRKAGYTLVTSAEREGTEVITVTLGAPSKEHAYEDTKLLIDYGLNNYRTETLDFSSEELLADHIIPELFAVTVPKEEGGGVEYSISEDGVLTVKGETGDLLHSSELEERYFTGLPGYIIPSKSNEIIERADLKPHTGILSWLIFTGFHTLYE